MSMPQKKKILVVDDSRTIRSMVAHALRDGGFEVIEASDGQAGAEALEQSPGIALVICDVNMPRMNGLEMLAAVKAQAKHSALPVLMLTTEGQPGLIRKAKEAGARGWMGARTNVSPLRL